MAIPACQKYDKIMIIISIGIARLFQMENGEKTLSVMACPDFQWFIFQVGTNPLTAAGGTRSGIKIRGKVTIV